MIVASCFDEDGVVEGQVRERLFLLSRLLEEIKRLKQKTFLFYVVRLCHGQSHIEQSVLVRVLIVLSLKDLFEREDLWLRWW